MNYDPNLTNSGRMSKQTVELVFQVWEKKETYTVEVRGNIRGLSVIQNAVENVYDNLPDSPYMEGVPVIYLKGEKGENGEEADVLECADDEDEGVEWLNDMLVSARIIAIEPYEG